MRQHDSAAAERYVVAIGRIVGAHSLTGEVRVESLTDIPDRFAQLDAVYMRPPRGEGRFVEIRGIREHSAKGLLILRLGGVDDRTAAERLRGSTLCVTGDDSPELPPGEYYEYQIMGLEVVTTDGRSLGPVTEIIHTGANDVYGTRACLIPAIPQVIQEIDLDAGRMVIEAVPGLLPDEESGTQRSAPEPGTEAS